MLGIVPAAGTGTRMQPLGCSKELLPVPRSAAGCDGAAGERRGPLMAVVECLLERMRMAGAGRICVVIGPDKTDLLRYLGTGDARLGFIVQPRAAGLCDAVFRAMPWVRGNEPVLIGLPDTIWFPADAYSHAPADSIHLITFPTDRPQDFDAVVAAPGDVDRPVRQVERIEVKCAGPGSPRRIWGAIRAPGEELAALYRLWLERERADVYLGTLLNAWIASGHPVTCDTRGTAYVDIGTPAAYAAALRDGFGAGSPSRQSLKTGGRPA